MKVLIVDLGSKFNALGGQARVAAILNKKLGRYFQTYYLGYRTEYSKGMRNPIFLERQKRLGLSVRRSRISEMWPTRFAYNLLIVRGMRDLDKHGLLERIRKINPEFIIANSIQDINLIRFLRKKGLSFKAIYIDHGSVSTSIGSYFSKEGIPLTVGTGIDSHTVAAKKRKFFGFYDMNVALNKNQLQAMLKFTKKVALVHNGMDIDARRDRRRESELMKKYGISSNDFVILYIGRMFDRQKNVSSLIRAFREINAGQVKLLLVGDGPSLSGYKILAEGDNRIIFAGSANDRDVNSIYNISNLFVLPSFWEGFSLTILEAASHLLPMALSRNAYIEDLRSKDIGKIVSFDPGNEAAIRESMIELYSDGELRKKAISASEKIKNKFTEKNMIDGYKRVIDRLS